MTKNGIFYSEISSLVPAIFEFLFKTDECHKSLINHKSKNIWGNI